LQYEFTGILRSAGPYFDGKIRAKVEKMRKGKHLYEGGMRIVSHGARSGMSKLNVTFYSIGDVTILTLDQG
jgi:hypothetical protein